MPRTLQLIKKDKVKKNIRHTKKFIRENSDEQNISLLNDDTPMIFRQSKEPDVPPHIMNNDKKDDNQKEEDYTKFMDSGKLNDVPLDKVILDEADNDPIYIDLPELVVTPENNPVGDSTPNVEMPRQTWDPRLIRVDAFNNGIAVIPFSTDTAASAYYDQVFTIEQAILDYDAGNGNTAGQDMSQVNSGRSSASVTKNFVAGQPGNGSNKTTPKNEVWKHMKDNMDMYGSQSLINPYCVTRLMGGLSMTTTNTAWGGFDSGGITHMYDIRDRRRFFDNVQSPDRHSSVGIVSKEGDFTSINNPTVDNIIRWSNADKWGRTPYSFQDFLFCKFWNIIPNNRLVTLRKYAVPTYDNLNFPTMMEKDGKETTYTTAPIATVVTYCGADTGNSMGQLMSFTTGTNWEELESDVHDVTGNEGSNPRALIDSMFEGSAGQPGFGGQNPISSIVGTLVRPFGQLTTDYISFGKFVGLLDKDGYQGNNQAVRDKLNAALVDPRDNIYANRILGPVNRISKVLKRKAGLEFSQSFKLKCEYVARPIGGVNAKAAILDIMANCMEMCSADAIWWGGGQKFMVTPQVYPFKGMNGSNNMMDALYKGKIFGPEGAVQLALSGVKNFSVNSSFEWSNITQKLSSVFSQTVGAVGSMLQSISSTLFGETSGLTKMLKTATNALSTSEEQAAGTDKVQNFLTNVNKMWEDRVVQQSVQPNITSLRSILTGEPTGNWHLTVGNPLNPAMVCGNLVCKSGSFSWSDEMGPDDFPLGLTVEFTIEHAMPRDKASIQSMFNRGGGKIYNLPDYIRATSDYESTVDAFTGANNTDLSANGAWMTPKFMRPEQIVDLNGGYGVYKSYKIDPGKELVTNGNPQTTKLTVFEPIDPANARYVSNRDIGMATLRSASVSARSMFFANLHTRKYNNG